MLLVGNPALPLKGESFPVGRSRSVLVQNSKCMLCILHMQFASMQQCAKQSHTPTCLLISCCAPAGFTTAVAVLAAVHQVLPLHIRWVCQQQPTDATVPNLAAAGLDIEYVVSPSQEELPVLYRGHDAFLFTSHYEAWGMPVLEAMACGLAVVTSSCFGVDTFAAHGRDCLMAQPEDVAGERLKNAW